MVCTIGTMRAERERMSATTDHRPVQHPTAADLSRETTECRSAASVAGPKPCHR